jgi:hypothetical protein
VLPCLLRFGVPYMCLEQVAMCRVSMRYGCQQAVRLLARLNLSARQECAEVTYSQELGAPADFPTPLASGGRRAPLTSRL